MGFACAGHREYLTFKVFTFVLRGALDFQILFGRDKWSGLSGRMPLHTQIVMVRGDGFFTPLLKPTTLRATVAYMPALQTASKT